MARRRESAERERDYSSARRISRVRRVLFSVFFATIAALTIVTLCTQLPDLQDAFQAGSSRAVANRAFFLGQLILSDCYLLVLDTSCDPAASALVTNLSFATVALQLDATSRLLADLIDELEHGGDDFATPTLTPTMGLQLDIARTNMETVLVASNAIFNETMAAGGNVTELTPTMAANVTTIVTTQPTVSRAVFAVILEIGTAADDNFNAVAGREIALNVATLAVLVLLAAVVYIPLEVYMSRLFMRLLERNDKLDAMARDMELLAQLNPNGIMRTDRNVRDRLPARPKGPPGRAAAAVAHARVCVTGVPRRRRRF